MNKHILFSNSIIKVLIIILPIILFLFITLFLYADIITNFESWVYSESVEHMSPFITGCVKMITHMGGSITVALLCLLLFLRPYTRKNYALQTSISVILSSSVNALLKNIFARPRPDMFRLVMETSYSFPSGHSMTNMAMYGTFALLAWKYMKSKKEKLIVAIICAVLVTAIGFSRIYLGVHYITDVIGGWCLGLAIALIVIFAYDNLQRQ